jgi:Bacterial Ig-like domain
VLKEVLLLSRICVFQAAPWQKERWNKMKISSFSVIALAFGSSASYCGGVVLSPPKDTTRSANEVKRGLADDRKTTVGSISSLELINSITDTEVTTLVDGMVIAVSEIEGMGKPSFNILAVAANEGHGVRSVAFEYSGSPYRRIEYAPFAFCGHEKGDFERCPRLVYGTHTVTVTPFSKNNAAGEPGEPYSITFTIVREREDPVETDSPALPPNRAPVATPTKPGPVPGGTVGKIRALELFNSKTDTKIMDLVNDTVVDIEKIQGMTSPTFNIKASVGDDGVVQSVKFGYNRIVTHRIDNGTDPFTFCSSSGTDYKRCRRLGYGTHTVTATPYAKTGGLGQAGSPYAVTFTVVNGDEDTAPPELVDLIALNSTTVDVTYQNAAIAMYVVVQDILSGFDSGYVAVYDSEESIFLASDSFALIKPIAATPITFSLTLTFQSTTPSGNYTLEVYLVDAVGNEIDIPADSLLKKSLPAYVEVVNLNSESDRTPPKLLNFTAVSPTRINVTSDENVVDFALVVRDETSSTISGTVGANFYDSDTDDSSFFDTSFTTFVPNIGEPVQLTVRLPIPEFVQPANYSLLVSLFDSKNFVYIQSDELARNGFTNALELFNDRYDDEPPKVLEIVVSSKRVNVSDSGALVTVQLVLQEKKSGIKNGYMQVFPPEGLGITPYPSFSFGRPQTGDRVKVNVTIPFKQYSPQGRYKFWLFVVDDAGNELFLTTEELARRKFPSYIDVINVNEDVLAPQLLDLVLLSSKKVNVTLGSSIFKVQIVAQDNISGVKAGSLSLYGRSYLDTTYFDFSRDTPVAGENTTINVSISIPQRTAPGSYSIELQLTDLAGNSILFFDSDLASQGFLSKVDVVNLRYDDNPPELVNFTAASPLIVNVSARPATVEFILVARDDLLGVQNGRLNLVDPQSAILNVGTSFSFDNETSSGELVIFKLSLNIPRYIRDATYPLEITLADRADNFLTLNQDVLEIEKFPSFITVVNLFEDITPPKLISFKAITPTTVNVSTGPASAVFELIVLDDLSGLRSTRLTLIGEAETTFFDYENVAFGRNKSVMFNISLDFFQTTRPETYELEVSLVDETNNFITFRPDDLLRLGFPNSLRIVNANKDFEPPDLIDVVALSSTTVNVTLERAEIEIAVTVKDGGSGFGRGTASLVDRESFYNISTTDFSSVPIANVPLTFNLTLSIPRYIASGPYDLSLYLVDAVSNEDFPLNDGDESQNRFSIEVVNKNEDVKQPELLNFTMPTPAVVDASSGITSMTFRVVANDDLSGIKNGLVQFFDSVTFSQYYESFEVPVEAYAAGKRTFDVVFKFEKDFQWSENYKCEIFLMDAALNAANFKSTDLAVLGFLSSLPFVPSK